MTPTVVVLVSSRADHLARYVVDAPRIDELAEVPRLLAARPRARGAAVILELVGHSSQAGRLLRLGRHLIDPLTPATATALTAWRAPLAAAGVVEVRLLGCSTAVGAFAQRALALLAARWRVPVAGTRRDLLLIDLAPRGLRPALASRLLVVASPPGSRPRPPIAALAAAPR
jgi:hypothetical protein